MSVPEMEARILRKACELAKNNKFVIGDDMYVGEKHPSTMYLCDWWNETYNAKKNKKIAKNFEIFFLGEDGIYQDIFKEKYPITKEELQSRVNNSFTKVRFENLEMSNIIIVFYLGIDDMGNDDNSQNIYYANGELDEIAYCSKDDVGLGYYGIKTLSRFKF